MRLIDADELEKTIELCRVNLIATTEYLQGYKDALYGVGGAINATPTVDTIHIPCKIGDSVWAIRNFKGVKQPQCGIVADMLFTQDMRLQIVVKYVARGEWGKDVFATFLDAKAYLDGERKDNERA